MAHNYPVRKDRDNMRQRFTIRDEDEMAILKLAMRTLLSKARLTMRTEMMAINLYYKLQNK